jgi:arginyl-tRNA synthetase
VIAETVREAYNVVKEKRGDELGEDALRKIAEAVGMGAVRFAMLQKTPRAQVKFIFEEVVNFKGYTALYAQYAYVRTCSLLAKAADDIGYKREDAEGADVSLLVHESEDDLILTLALFPQTLRDALDRLDTTRLTQYVFDLAGAFNQFYKDCPVIPAGPPLRLARLALTEATRQVLGVALQTLGIPLLERM